MIRKTDLYFATRLLILVVFMLGIQTGVVLGLSINLNTSVVAEAADSTSITVIRKNGKKIVPIGDIKKEDSTVTEAPPPIIPTDINKIEEVIIAEPIVPVIAEPVVPTTTNDQMKIEYTEEIDNVELPKEEVKEDEDVLGDIINVPKDCGSFKAYMSFRAITNSNSKQYKLQQSENMWTDSEGMERYNDDYVVAVGKYFAGRVGDRLLVHMENGTDFTVIVGDFKALKDTDAKNMYTPGNKSIIEFLVDTKKLNKTVKRMGDVSYLPTIDISGKVASIQKITNVSDEIAALYK